MSDESCLVLCQAGRCPSPCCGGPSVGKHQDRCHALCATQELNRIFVRSDRLNSEAIVEFVRALCTVAREELRTPGAPRVYSLTKIVEIAHFNMTRIRCAAHLSAHGMCTWQLELRSRSVVMKCQLFPCMAIQVVSCSRTEFPPAVYPAPTGWCGAASGRCWRTSSWRWGATPTCRSPCTASTRCGSWR